MLVGIGSYSLVWAIGSVRGFPAPDRMLSAMDLVDEAARLGLQVVQICDNLPLDRMSDADLRALRGRAEALGVRLEAGTRGSEPALLERYIEVAGALGSPVLRTLLTPADTAEETVGRGKVAIRAILPLLEAARVTLVLENYEHLRVERLRQLIDDIGSPRVAACLDPVNNFGAGQDPERAIEALAPVAACVHIKDFRVARLAHRLGYELTGAPAGEGQLDVPRLLAAARGSAILEQWVPWQGTIQATVELEREWLERSAANMRRWRDLS